MFNDESNSSITDPVETAILQIFADLRIRLGEGIAWAIFLAHWPSKLPIENFQIGMNSLIAQGLVQIPEGRPGFYHLTPAGLEKIDRYFRCGVRAVRVMPMESGESLSSSH